MQNTCKYIPNTCSFLKVHAFSWCLYCMNWYVFACIFLTNTSRYIRLCLHVFVCILLYRLYKHVVAMYMHVLQFQYNHAPGHAPCMYLYVYCIYKYVCLYMHVLVCICMSVCICMYTCICMYSLYMSVLLVSACICVLYIYVCMLACIECIVCICVYAYVLNVLHVCMYCIYSMYMHVYSRMCLKIHSYTCIHKQYMHIRKYIPDT